MSPLPEFWEETKDAYGRTYFIDHKTSRTTWFDPRVPVTNQHVPHADGPVMMDETAQGIAQRQQPAHQPAYQPAPRAIARNIQVDGSTGATTTIIPSTRQPQTVQQTVTHTVTHTVNPTLGQTVSKTYVNGQLVSTSVPSTIINGQAVNHVVVPSVMYAPTMYPYGYGYYGSSFWW